MKYRKIAVKAPFVIYVVALSFFGAAWLAFSVWALFEKMLLGFLLSVMGIGGIILFVLWYGKLMVRIVEIYGDKIVFIPIICRKKRKEIAFEEIKQIRVTEELAFACKKGLSIQICCFYDFDLLGDEKIYSVHPFRIESTPETDKLVEELFRDRVPFIKNSLV